MPANDREFLADMPMCGECGAILNDDGTCPDAADHGASLLDLWSERNALDCTSRDGAPS